jgi:hypothetical protein
VNVRQPAGIAMLVLLAACRSAPPPQQNKKPSYQGRIHVRDFLATPENCGMVHYVRPVYPKEAKVGNVQHLVSVRYLITKTGQPRDMQVISGDPALVPAALAAVAQWRFAPCRIEGSDPIEHKATSDVPFWLNQ